MDDITIEWKDRHFQDEWEVRFGFPHRLGPGPEPYWVIVHGEPHDDWHDPGWFGPGTIYGAFREKAEAISLLTHLKANPPDYIRSGYSREEPEPKDFLYLEDHVVEGRFFEGSWFSRRVELVSGEPIELVIKSFDEDQWLGTDAGTDEASFSMGLSTTYKGGRLIDLVKSRRFQREMVLRIDGPDLPSVREEFERALAIVKERFEEWNRD